MTITVIGTGFVGVVTAAVYASLGHQVWGLDIDEKKVASLSASRVPFYEPNLEEMLTETQKKGNLKFSSDYSQAIPDSDLIVIAVGTPSALDGGVDLKYVMAVGESIAPYLKADTIVAVKSTVPPGTLTALAAVIEGKTSVDYETASLPEFLREGSAVNDTLHPDRVVIGARSKPAFDKLNALHAPLTENIINISPESAQMAKYSANAYLATRITFINQIADLCEKNGADVEEVVKAMGSDSRIGSHYWYPGLGYGGSCFPKDVQELAYFSRKVGEGDNLFNKIHELNQKRLGKLLAAYDQKVGGMKGKKVAVLGLAFKPHTDDTREAPSLYVVPKLNELGARVVGYDPKVLWQDSWGKLHQLEDLAAAVEDVDVIMILVEWPDIISFDFNLVRQPQKIQWLIDTRNRLDACQFVQQGWQYIGVGRQVNCDQKK